MNEDDWFTRWEDSIGAGCYVLDDARVPRKVSMAEYMRWMLTSPRLSVAYDMIDDVLISTVFIGIDSTALFGGPPCVFETMILGGEHDHFQNRCSTWEQAEMLHALTVSMFKSGRIIK
jgi:hypothetical protein